MRPFCAAPIVILALVLGCPKTPPDYQQSRGATSSEPCLVDATDRCPVLPDGCPSFEDDGCPDVVIELEAGCAHDRTQSLLDQIAARMQTEPRFARVTIHGDPNLASCVASGIEKRGIEAARLATQDDKLPYVYFEVTAWDGEPCSQHRGAPQCD